MKVHCCGAHWIAHVPAIDCWTLIRDKRQIGSTTRLMIANVTGTATDSVGVDLSEGRAVADAEEFGNAAVGAVRWVPGEGEQSVSAALRSACSPRGWCQPS